MIQHRGTVGGQSRIGVLLYSYMEHNIDEFVAAGGLGLHFERDSFPDAAARLFDA